MFLIVYNRMLQHCTHFYFITGPPSCSSIFPKFTVSLTDDSHILKVSWNVNTCTVKPTEYKVTLSEIENESIVSSSERINKTFYTINVTTCKDYAINISCLLYTSPSPRDRQKSRMPSSA